MAATPPAIAKKAHVSARRTTDRSASVEPSAPSTAPKSVKV